MNPNNRDMQQCARGLVRKGEAIAVPKRVVQRHTGCRSPKNDRLSGNSFGRFRRPRRRAARRDVRVLPDRTVTRAPWHSFLFSNSLAKKTHRLEVCSSQRKTGQRVVARFARCRSASSCSILATKRKCLGAVRHTTVPYRTAARRGLAHSGKRWSGPVVTSARNFSTKLILRVAGPAATVAHGLC